MDIEQRYKIALKGKVPTEALLEVLVDMGKELAAQKGEIRILKDRFYKLDVQGNPE